MKVKIDARRQALRFLERMDRTEHELAIKLKDKGYDDDEINDAIGFVKSYNYVNDKRFTEHFIEIHIGSKSRRRINYDLKNKGINDNLIEDAWYKFEPYDEKNLIIKQLLKKVDPENPPEFNELQKIKSSLVRKGFNLSDINSVVSEYLT